MNEVTTARNQLTQLRIIEKPLHSYVDEEEELDVSMEELKQSDAEKMSVIVSQLLAKNVMPPLFRRSAPRMPLKCP